MPQFYKASKSIKGAGCSFGLNSSEQSLFISVVKQSAYNEGSRTGSFAGDKLAIKCSLTEIGALLDVLNRNVSYSTVHQSKNAQTQIWFEPYYAGEGEAKVQRGYGLKITRKTGENEVRVLMPFNFSEAEVLREYFSFCMRQMFHTEYSEAKKQYKAKTEKVEKSPAPVAAPEPVMIGAESEPYQLGN